MDINCAICQEPWEHYHMLHDMVWDAWDGVENSSSHKLCKKFLDDPNRTLNEMMRSDLASAGWKFGQTIFAIHQCPCCDGIVPDDQKEAVEQRIELRNELESLLAGDMDGLISEMSGIDVYMNIREL